MKTRKYPKADIHRYRSIFFRISMILSLCMVIMAFKWTVYYAEVDQEVFRDDIPVIISEIIPPTTIPEKKLPEPPKRKLPDILNKVKISTEPKAIDTSKRSDQSNRTGTSIDSIVFFDEPATPDTIDIGNLQDKPVFPGDLDRWLISKIKPPTRECGQPDDVIIFVQFIINTLGEVTGTKILKSPCYGYDREIKRVFKEMPKWEPGKQMDRPVAVIFRKPIRFY